MSAPSATRNHAAVRYRQRMLIARVIVVAVVLGIPLALGARVHGIGDDDMAPVLRVGDAVVTWPLAPAAAAPGDLVTFRDPDDPDRIVTRQVVEVAPIGPVVAFGTGGYAAPQVERWHVAAEGRIGVVSRRIPLLGHLLLALATSAGRALLLGLLIVPAIGLGVLASSSRRPTGRHRAVRVADPPKARS